MKWILTTLGTHAHAVGHNQKRTLCGIRLKHAGTIVPNPGTDKCENCDYEWRREGHKLSKKSMGPRDVYDPIFSFQDWEDR